MLSLHFSTAPPDIWFSLFSQSRRYSTFQKNYDTPRKIKPIESIGLIVNLRSHLALGTGASSEYSTAIKFDDHASYVVCGSFLDCQLHDGLR